MHIFLQWQYSLLTLQLTKIFSTLLLILEFLAHNTHITSCQSPLRPCLILFSSKQTTKVLN